MQHGHQSNPVVHSWGHFGDGRKHENGWKWMDAIDAVRDNLTTFGTQRVNMILGIGSEPEDLKDEIDLARKSRFGIGTKRTLEQAVEFTGINLRERKMDVNKCGNLIWVPFEESPDYGVGETLSRSNAGETVRPFVVSSDHGSYRSVLEEIDMVERKLADESTDFKLMGGVFLVGLAIALKLFMKTPEKAASHKE